MAARDSRHAAGCTTGKVGGLGRGRTGVIPTPTNNCKLGVIPIRVGILTRRAHRPYECDDKSIWIFFDIPQGQVGEAVDIGDESTDQRAVGNECSGAVLAVP